MAHTPGPWSVGHTRKQDVDERLQPMWETSVHVGERERAGNALAIAYLGGRGALSMRREDVEATAHLIALAPTAPHDCDLPSCPGAVTKRKLEAAEKLLAALKGLLADIQDYQRVNRLGGEDNHWQVLSRQAIEAYERSL